jgi:hypothetical protein
VAQVVNRVLAELDTHYNPDKASPVVGFVRLSGLAHADERIAFREIARQLCMYAPLPANLLLSYVSLFLFNLCDTIVIHDVGFLSLPLLKVFKMGLGPTHAITLCPVQVTSAICTTASLCVQVLLVPTRTCTSNSTQIIEHSRHVV